MTTTTTTPPSSSSIALGLHAAYSSRLPPTSLSTLERNLFFSPPNTILPDNDTTIASFIRIRNKLLTPWILDGSKPVTLELANELNQNKELELVELVYNYLIRYRYINFGLVKDSSRNGVKVEKNGERKLRIVVVGAGMAGLTTARELINLLGDRVEIVILEARDRVGGRVHTHKLQTKPKNPTPESANPSIDLGAAIITGFEKGNPLRTILQHQLRAPLHYLLHANGYLHDMDGMPLPPETDSLSDEIFNEILDDCCHTIFDARTGSKPKLVDHLLKTERVEYETSNPDYAQCISLGDVFEYYFTRHPKFLELSPMEKRAVHWHLANLEFANGALLRDLSLLHWDQDDDYEFEGNHAMIINGYGQLADAYAKGLNIHFNKIVTNIDTQPNTNSNSNALARIESNSSSSSGSSSSSTAKLPSSPRRTRRTVQESTGPQPTGLVRIKCSDGTSYEADALVFTAPLGVLKQDTIEFTPPLPPTKQTVIRRMGFGWFNKVVLVFPRDFWSNYYGYHDVFNTICGPIVPYLEDLGATKLLNEGANGNGHVKKPNGPIQSNTYRTMYTPLDLDEKYVNTSSNKNNATNGSTTTNGSPPKRTTRGTTQEYDASFYAASRGLFFQFWNATSVTHLPTLVAFVSGEAAHLLESMNDDDIVLAAMDALRKVFPRETNGLPKPVETIITRWSQDPFARGTYSFMARGSTGKDYDLLAEPVGNTMFFAGEATMKNYPSTVHGAMLSGMRAATEITNKYLGDVNKIFTKPSSSSSIKSASRANNCHLCQHVLDPHESLLDHITFAHSNDFVPIQRPASITITSDRKRKLLDTSESQQVYERRVMAKPERRDGTRRSERRRKLGHGQEQRSPAPNTVRTNNVQTNNVQTTNVQTNNVQTITTWVKLPNRKRMSKIN